MKGEKVMNNKKPYIGLGTETLIGKVIRIYYGKHYIIQCKYMNICLSRDEVLKILPKSTCKNF